MTSSSLWSLLLFLGVLAIVCPLLGRYLAAVFGGGPAPGDRFFRPIERRIYRAIGTAEDLGQRWGAYAFSVLGLSFLSLLGLYVLLRLQGHLPFNPTHAPGMGAALAFDTAASFVTGTNWQAYAGETAASHLAQMTGFVVMQFLAAAVGLAVAIALVRSLATRGRTIGNFWVDLTRSLLRVLLPIAVPAALLLVALGTTQNLHGYRVARTLEGATQVLPGGPVATQVVMKTLGTNGGGFYNANSAHPFDNPNGLTNFLQILLCLIIPFALPFMFGALVKDRRQGRTLLVVMAVLWVVPLLIGMIAESHGNAALPASVNQSIGAGQSGGNMEGKDVRFGAGESTLLTLGSMGTTAGIASSGIDSYTPTGQAASLGPILLGEVSPGGVGSGLAGMLVNVLLATFLAGLMIGRTPIYLGRRVGPVEMKFVMLATLIVPITVLGIAAIGTVVAGGTVSQAGSHGLTEILYAAASATNANGSAICGLTVGGPWWLMSLGVAMLIGRFLVIVPVLALAGLFARQPFVATTSASLDTGGRTFTWLLLFVVIVVGGLTYLPSPALSVIHSIIA